MMESTHFKFDLDCFNQFRDSPKDVSIEVIKSAHKHIARAIKSPEMGPTNQEMIDIFNQFAQEPIPKYVFTRMTKPLLLELVLCIIQEILLNGIGRASSIRLEAVKLKAGGKIVQIVDQFAEEEVAKDEDMFQHIDEAYFRLLDSEGKSPDVKISVGQGHGVPYSPFADDGAFVRPKPRAVRSLDASIEVVSFSFFPFSCGLCPFFLLALSLFLFSPFLAEKNFIPNSLHYRRRQRNLSAMPTSLRSH